MNGARAGFCCRSGAVGAMKTAEVNGARAGFCCRSGAVGAMKTADVMARGPGFAAVAAQGLHRAAVTRGLAAGPERFEGRSRYNSLSPMWRPSGVSAAWAGPTASILKGPVQYSGSFSLRPLLSAPFRKPWRIVAAVF